MSAPMLVAGSISLATSFLGSLISIVLHGRVLWTSSKQLSFSMVAYAFGASALMQIVGKGLPEADERVRRTHGLAVCKVAGHEAYNRPHAVRHPTEADIRMRTAMPIAPPRALLS